MALDYTAEASFTGKINTPGATYPYGQPRDVTAPGNNDGTPWNERIAQDLFGFLQALLGDASITPSGNPDNATTSDYLDAIKAIVVEDHELHASINNDPGTSYSTTSAQIIDLAHTGIGKNESESRFYIYHHDSNPGNLTPAEHRIMVKKESGTTSNIRVIVRAAVPSDGRTETYDISTTFNTEFTLYPSSVFGRDIFAKFVRNSDDSVSFYARQEVGDDAVYYSTSGESFVRG